MIKRLMGLMRLIRYDRTVIICALIAGGLAGLYSFITPPIYKATIRISIEPGNIGGPITRNVDLWKAYTKDEANVLKDKEFLNRLSDKLHLKLSKRFANTDPVAVLQKAIKVKAMKNVDILEISVYMDNPELASRIAKALIETYISRKEEKKITLSGEVMDWLKEAKETSERIKEPQMALNKFITENKLETLKDDLRKTTETFDELIRLRDENEMAIMRLERKLAACDTYLKSGEKEKLCLELKDSSVFEELKMRKDQTELQLSRLKRIYEEKHPTIEKLKSEIVEIDAIMEEMANNMLKSSRLELESSRKNVDIAAKEIVDARARLDALKEAEAKVNDLERRVETAKSLYNSILDRLKESQFYMIELTNLGFVGQQDAPAAIVWPKKGFNIILGLLAGFILGNLIVRFKERGKAQNVAPPSTATPK